MSKTYVLEIVECTTRTHKVVVTLDKESNTEAFDDALYITLQGSSKFSEVHSQISNMSMVEDVQVKEDKEPVTELWED